MISLLSTHDPVPVGIVGADAPSPFLLIADHAGNAVPASLNSLGLPLVQLERHIGIDIGILGTCERLAFALDAALIYQRYSRLVIDCNRPPDTAEAILTYSDGADVPGNRDLSPADRALRVADIFHPYHARITAQIDRRDAAGQPTVLVAMHSFTPSHGDLPDPRPWHVGVLYNRDSRLAEPLLALLEAEGDIVVGRNQPYGVDDSIDYAVPVHGEARGLLHVELEIRQDLIADARGQQAWASRLARLLPLALRAVKGESSA